MLKKATAEARAKFENIDIDEAGNIEDSEYNRKALGKNFDSVKGLDKSSAIQKVAEAESNISQSGETPFAFNSGFDTSPMGSSTPSVPNSNIGGTSGSFGGIPSAPTAPAKTKPVVMAQKNNTEATKSAAAATSESSTEATTEDAAQFICQREDNCTMQSSLPGLFDEIKSSIGNQSDPNVRSVNANALKNKLSSLLSEQQQSSNSVERAKANNTYKALSEAINLAENDPRSFQQKYPGNIYSYLTSKSNEATAQGLFKAVDRASSGNYYAAADNTKGASLLMNMSSSSSRGGSSGCAANFIGDNSNCGRQGI